MRASEKLNLPQTWDLATGIVIPNLTLKNLNTVGKSSQSTTTLKNASFHQMLKLIAYQWEAISPQSTARMSKMSSLILPLRIRQMTTTLPTPDCLSVFMTLPLKPRTGITRPTSMAVASPTRTGLPLMVSQTRANTEMKTTSLSGATMATGSQLMETANPTLMPADSGAPLFDHDVPNYYNEVNRKFKLYSS